jgi:hypothetical protein
LGIAGVRRCEWRRRETDLRGDAGEGEPAARRRRWGSVEGEPAAGIGGVEEQICTEGLGSDQARKASAAT